MRIGVTLLGILVGILTVDTSVGQSARSEGTFTRPLWGNGHLWEVISPKVFGTSTDNPAGNTVFGSPANDSSHQPYYVIGPDAGDDGAHSELFFGPHDHVAAVPPRNHGTFNANWHIHLVFPHPDAPAGSVASSGDFAGTGAPLAHAADIDDDPGLEDLTSAERVEKAALLGYVEVVETPEVFVCPVRDIEG